MPPSLAAIGFNPEAESAVTFVFKNAAPIQSPLFDAIPRRQSTHAEYDGTAVDGANLGSLTAAAAIPGVDVVLTTDRAQLDRVRDLVIAGNNAQMADPAFMRELKFWLRFSPRRAIASGQRFALQATTLGLKIAFINQPVEVARLRPELASLVGMAGRRPDIVMRFGYGPTLPYSPRRPVSAVLA